MKAVAKTEVEAAREGASRNAAPLPPLIRGWLGGRDRDLLTPLHWLGEGELPAAAPPCPGRGPLAAALAEANAAYGHPRARELAAKLADPATQVVVTGQQPGLFGGPLYTLLKAVGAVLWAERLEREGRPAVAVFWMATEDHDFDEVATARFWSGRDALEVRVDSDAAGLAPVGTLTLGAGVEAAIATLRETFGYEPFAAWLDRLGRWYRPDARFGEAMARLLVDLLGERSPLVLDALLPELKAAERPWLRRLVEERARGGEAVAAAERVLEERGHPLQVSPQPAAAPLFVLRRGGRRRVIWEGDDRYRLRGLEESWPVRDLLETLDENPSAVSPNVLSRPAVQDAVLGTAVFVLGPGELAYMAQARALYEVLGVSAPAVTLRPQALLADARQLAVLEELGVSGDILWQTTEEVDTRLAGGEAEDMVGPAREQVVAALEAIRDAALELDPNLERPWEKTRDHVLRGLDTFADKVTRAAAHRDEAARQRLSRLRAYVAPGGTPHERTLSIAYFRGRYGEGLGRFLLDRLALAPGWVQTLDPAADAPEEEAS